MIQRVHTDPVARVTKAAAKVAQHRAALAVALAEFDRASREIVGGDPVAAVGPSASAPAPTAGGKSPGRRKPGPRPGRKRPTNNKPRRKPKADVPAVAPAARRAKQAPAFRPPAIGARAADVLLSSCLPVKFAASLASKGIHTAQDLIAAGATNGEKLPALLGDAFTPRGAAMIVRLMRRFDSAGIAGGRGGNRRRRAAEAPAAAVESVGAGEQDQPP